MRTSLSNNNIALDLPSSHPTVTARSHAPIPCGAQPTPAQQRPGADQGRRPALGPLQHLRPVDQRRSQHRQLLVRHRSVCVGPWRLADSAVPGDRRGAGVLLHEPVRLHGPEDRRAVSGHQPDQFRHSRGADSCIDPCRYRHRLVRDSDVPGLGGLSRVTDGRTSRFSPTTTTTRSSVCRPWAGYASWRSGSCSWRSSPTAWKWCGATKRLPGR
jgi:hypothetical protein